jgi:hypothetical protein
MRSTHFALIGVVLLLSGCADPGADGAPAAALPADDPGARFHGAWELASVVRYAADGEELSRNESSTGFIMYDPAGTMGVVIQGADRQPSTEGQPTPEDRLAAYRSYTAYFGAFSVDPEAGAVTHHLRASMNPNAAGADYVRSYEFAGDALTLQPPAGADGGTVRLTWRKLPELGDLTDVHRRFSGFWHFDRLERRDQAGQALPVERTWVDGFIIYTSSGHMAVHLVRPDRQPFADGRPTAEEATAAIRTYISYFGPYTIHADDGYVVHHRSGCWFPSCMDTDAQRFYEFGDGTLTLQPPAREVDGEMVQDSLVWKRISE